ncbi:ZTL protein [Solimonas sp. K1W22B-7]|uniref:ZTL protein n=1 Tax=Solimonas sp. K1W22B-7 TaxID=2303331 RepID=UPI000E332676|nr:ZTL protein [Solimonas sp. K1W22B-7]AXQ27855.1 ZTL protein [Solimonas sp. K1W22B-7]
MAQIVVLAGTNGAGKSSVGGEALLRAGARFFNPDLETRNILAEYPGMSLDEANALAWNKGAELLRRAIDGDLDYAFETTLGGKTITDLLIEASRRGMTVRMWYCGLTSPELHIERVAARVAAGGHDIPEHKIRERYDASRANLIRLLPHLEELRVFDNSENTSPETLPEAGAAPALLLATRRGRVSYIDSGRMQEWVKPIAAAAMQIGFDAAR